MYTRIDSAAGPSPIRLVSDIGPVKGASNTDLICGLSAKNAELVVPASPGSVFSVQWSGGDGIDKVRAQCFIYPYACVLIRSM